MGKGKKAGIIAAVVIAIGLVVGALTGSSSSKVTVDQGGGLPAGSPAPEPQAAIHTLPPVGNAPQDPGGGGGGACCSAPVGPPGVLQPGAGGGGGGGGGGGSTTFYLSGSALLDVNRGAVGSGQVQVAGAGATGCAAYSAGGHWAAVPLRRPITISGGAHAHIRASSGRITLSFVDLDSNGNCVRGLSSGSATASGGVADISLGADFTYPVGHIPAVAITAVPGATITTDGANPSFITVGHATGI
jgi:hypothetical protein